MAVSRRVGFWLVASRRFRYRWLATIDRLFRFEAVARLGRHCFAVL